MRHYLSSTVLTLTAIVTGIIFFAAPEFADGADTENVPFSTDPAGKLTLVKDGESVAPIVIFAEAPKFTRRAADDLQEYIRKTSGAKPDIIEGQPEDIPEHAIWVGYQPVMDELFPAVDLEFKHPEEILIAANGDHLVIAGRDRWDPENMHREGGSYKGRNAGLDGVQQEYGTANAVYTFLQDYLGVRWLWPGETGEDTLQADTIAYEPFQYRYHPQFRGRAAMIRFSSLYSWRGHSHEWMRFQRLQLDSFSVPGGHPMSGWWNRFHETHPEVFAQQPDGTRGGGDEPYPSARTVKFCMSNPELWQQWLADVESDLEQDPNKRVFGANTNDGGYSGYCICSKCRDWDHPDAQIVTHSWQGLGQKYVAVSDRQVTFANTLARMLKERHPDRDFYVSGMAYGNSRPAPVESVPSENVIFSVVANFHNRPSGHNIWPGGDHREDLVAWSEKVSNLGWRPNLGGGAGWKKGFLNVAPYRVIDDMKFAAEHNVIALFFDTVWEHWVNQGPHYYMLARMAWNPEADGEAILEDYYQRAFGPAAGTMADYWGLMDEASEDILFNDKPESEAWDEEFYQQAYSYLNQAETEIAEDKDLYQQRLNFVRAGLDYMRLYRENEALIERLKETESEDKEAEEAARANWEKIVQIFKDYPHAFNKTYIAPGRPRLERINPDSDQ